MSAASEALARPFGLVSPGRITEGITHRQLAILLREAAADAGRQVLSLSSSNNTVRRVQLAQVRSALENVSAQVWSGTGRIIVAGEYAQADLAAHQALVLDGLSGVPDRAVRQMEPYFNFRASQSVDDIISHRTNGYTLAQRIYANGNVSTRQVGRIVDRALAQQLSPRELARQVRGFYRPDVPGGASYASMRLARTEINNAHHNTTIRLTQDKPWVTGYKWNLSGSHPRPDECNEYASHNEDLGSGVWSKGEVPDKPHPQCLCYLTMIYPDEDELIHSIASGEYDSYLDKAGARSGSTHRPADPVLHREISAAARASNELADQLVRDISQPNVSDVSGANFQSDIHNNVRPRR